MRVRPSPWLNPHALVASSEVQACAQFEAYASARADLLQWLRPLAGQRLVAEAGITGVHVKTLAEILQQISNSSNDHPTQLDLHTPVPTTADTSPPDACDGDGKRKICVGLMKQTDEMSRNSYRQVGFELWGGGAGGGGPY